MGRRVVLTGAAGRIGRRIAPLLPPEWDLAPTDLTDTPHRLDVTDLAACRTAFAGADAVVHLAAVPDPEATWEQLLPANLVGTHHVAQAAADCGVRRLVLAGSLQALSAVPDEVQVRGSDAPRPANLYGATKAWSEAVGSWLAATSSTSVVVLRIGFFYEEPPTDAVPARDRAAWLSIRDTADLVRAAVEAPGVTFFVAQGISANRYRRADLTQTCKVLGYRPVDDAWAAQ